MSTRLQADTEDFSLSLSPLSFTDGQGYPRVWYCVSKHLLLSAAIHLSVSLLWFCYPETIPPPPPIVFLKEVDPSSAVLSYNDNEWMNVSHKVNRAWYILFANLCIPIVIFSTFWNHAQNQKSQAQLTGLGWQEAALQPTSFSHSY